MSRQLLTMSLLLCVAFFSIAFAPDAKKYPYTSVEGKMSIKFPAAYEVDSNPSGKVTTVKITTTLNEQTFFASYSLHETEDMDHEKMAKVSLQSFSERVGGEITEESVWQVKKDKGVKAVIDMAEQESKVQYQVILVGNIQYQIVVVASYDAWDQKAADKFFKSFKIKK